MKPALILLFIFPVFVHGQNCKLISSKDPYTREIKISTGLIPLNTVEFSIEATKSNIDFMFVVQGKCFDDASTAVVYYEGSRSKTNLRNSGTMNCEGLFHLSFKNTDPTTSSLENFSTRKISSIRFRDNTNKETSTMLTDPQQQMLMNLVNCVIAEAKKLLK